MDHLNDLQNSHKNKRYNHKVFKPDDRIEFASDFVSSADIHSILIYKGKKYNWQAKQELHIHIIEHPFLDCLELVGRNSFFFPRSILKFKALL